MPFLAQQKLPHRIPASAYRTPEICAREIQWMRQNTWQFVCTTDELNEPGKFITTTLLNEPIIVRNFDGEIVALSNVCAHRHSLIRSEKAGSAAELSCQYHGWCYGKDGLTRKIPCAKDLAPIDRAANKIATYRSEVVGRLVFITLSSNVKTLEEYLGPMYEIYLRRCSADWPMSLQYEVEYDANWKVAVENTLEAYHVQCVHPDTFRTDPGEMRSDHKISSRHSSFQTDMPFAAENRTDLFFQRAQSNLVSWLGGTPRREYEHHHLCPNLLTSFTDAITLVQSVVPIAHNRSRSIIRQFGYQPEGVSKFKRWVAKKWGGLEAAIGKRILKEDFEMLPKIQAGLDHSDHAGVLARSEERIAAFQTFWCNEMFICEHAGDGI